MGQDPGNLKAVGAVDRAPSISSTTIYSRGADVLVGSRGGSRLFNPGAAPPPASSGSGRRGRRMAGARIWGRDPTPPETRNILRAETLYAARWAGVWELFGPFGVAAQPAARLRASTADHSKWSATRQALMVNLFDLSRSDTDPVFDPVRGSTFDRIEIYTRGGDDTLTLDHSYGAVQVPQGIRYDGGEDGSNSLVLKGEAYGARRSGTDADGKRFEEVFDIKDRRHPSTRKRRHVRDAGSPRDRVGVVTLEGAMIRRRDAHVRDELSQLPLSGPIGRALNGGGHRTAPRRRRRGGAPWPRSLGCSSQRSTSPPFIEAAKAIRQDLIRNYHVDQLPPRSRARSRRGRGLDNGALTSGFDIPIAASEGFPGAPTRSDARRNFKCPAS